MHESFKVRLICTCSPFSLTGENIPSAPCFNFIEAENFITQRTPENQFHFQQSEMFMLAKATTRKEWCDIHVNPNRKPF